MKKFNKDKSIEFLLQEYWEGNISGIPYEQWEKQWLEDYEDPGGPGTQDPESDFHPEKFGWKPTENKGLSGFWERTVNGKRYTMHKSINDQNEFVDNYLIIKEKTIIFWGWIESVKHAEMLFSKMLKIT